MMRPDQLPEMTCRQARLLMVPVWVNDPDITQQQREAFEAHLLVCSTCAAEYAETERLTTDLFLFSLRAGAYLTNTRTAAHLWFKEKSEKAQAVWDDKQQGFPSMPSSPPGESQAIESLTEHLAGQVTALHRVIDASQELSIAPRADKFDRARKMSPNELPHNVAALSGGVAR